MVFLSKVQYYVNLIAVVEFIWTKNEVLVEEFFRIKHQRRGYIFCSCGIYLSTAGINVPTLLHVYMQMWISALCTYNSSVMYGMLNELNLTLGYTYKNIRIEDTVWRHQEKMQNMCVPTGCHVRSVPSSLHTRVSLLFTDEFIPERGLTSVRPVASLSSTFR